MDLTPAVNGKAQNARKYSLFVFGDSLSDTGNLFKQTFGLGPPSPPYFKGRFSNGPVAAETLAEQLGFSLSLKTNFAIGGARTDRDNGLNQSGFRFGGLLTEIDRFKPQAKSLEAGPEDLYLVWVGANDLLSIAGDPTSAANPTGPINAAVTNIVNSVQAIAQSGAKNIVVVQTPNLGRTPTSLQTGQSQTLTSLSIAFNSALETAFSGLPNPSLRGKNIILVNLLPVSEAIAQTPAAFGFSNVTQPLLQAQTANPGQFFFWDVLHPTSRGHDIFADVLQNAVLSKLTDRLTRTGTAENDRLVGFGGRDRLDGGAGADYLAGNANRDTLLGSSGNDILIGGAGADVLIGGRGRDALTGGSGRDRFTYTSTRERNDRISDFEAGQDLIDLRQIFSSPIYERSNRLEAYVKLTRVNGGTAVEVDTNGDSALGFKVLAQLAGVQPSELGRSRFLVQ